MYVGNNFEANIFEDCDYQLAKGIIQVYQNYLESITMANEAKKHIKNFDYINFKEKLIKFIK